MTPERMAALLAAWNAQTAAKLGMLTACPIYSWCGLPAGHGGLHYHATEPAPAPSERLVWVRRGREVFTALRTGPVEGETHDPVYR